MNKKLYNELFQILDGLGAIRKDLSSGCKILVNDDEGEWDTIIYASYVFKEKKQFFVFPESECATGCVDENDFKIIGHPPILSDCLNAIHLVGGNGAVATTGKIIANLARTKRANGSYTEMQWDLSKPLLSEQSDELGECLLELLTK